MRAIVCPEFGPPRVLRVEERPAPEPGPEEITVAPHAWGINYVDVLMVAGGYQLRPGLPFVPGLEGAGIVTGVGPGVSTPWIGDRVIFGMRPGAFAERVAVPASGVVPMPESMSFEQGACFRSAFATAYHGLVQGGRLRAGEVALVHGATGGMGLAAVQVAKRLGATVIGTGGSEEKLRVVKQYGADHVIDYGRGRFREQVRKLCGGADVIFDPIGGDVFDESMHCLNWGARLVVVGFTSGRAARARTNHLLIKGASVIGIRAGEFSRRHPEEGRENLITLLEWARKAQIYSHISHRFTFPDILPAMRVIENREVVGRAIMVRDSR